MLDAALALAVIIGTILFSIWYLIDRSRSRAHHRKVTALQRAGQARRYSPEQTKQIDLDLFNHNAKVLFHAEQVAGRTRRPFNAAQAIGTALFFGELGHGLYRLGHSAGHPRHFNPYDLDSQG